MLPTKNDSSDFYLVFYMDYWYYELGLTHLGSFFVYRDWKRLLSYTQDSCGLV